MSSEHAGKNRHNPLGQAVEYACVYDPGLLFPIPRGDTRAGLGLTASLPFTGCDVWNAWEVSWLEPGGKPRVARARLQLPVASPNLVESKSLKLYLNGFNQERFEHPDDVAAVIARDLSAAAGARVAVELVAPDAGDLPLQAPPGQCLDDIALVVREYQAAPELLLLDQRRGTVEESVHSHLLRSLCPVTGQPDWGTLAVSYAGPAIDHAALLGYIISFRQHQDYHEHCVERMFVDIHRLCTPDRLTIEARYLRRGGLDINPFRSSEADAAPAHGRWYRQ
ncbi:NADPH-dependent 7-cyano-7-deazaguanine reductase QueF [Methylonatrum kenyense]|uniref:NADPH-dependent 7-cyano-7-deazaguanine reductase QueF n=1 Tax=Methylonatrum kenyense TaxID=455253 RepID=UPI00200A0F2E|nr:NADPH-dependent 7-cyano-7-deazaguanine reductase QueF [Methylonatrum kenyense]MCK8517148.1 NADPH-dependent 7-cyano-7-deazaguanine reductase QueF [Methylonatrum kenyense]